jgi:hypothetical protein
MKPLADKDRPERAARRPGKAGDVSGLSNQTRPEVRLGRGVGPSVGPTPISIGKRLVAIDKIADDGALAGAAFS